MKITVKTLAYALVALLPVSAVLAENTNELGKTESALAMPSVEVGLFYSSMKIERGAVEIPESVFGYEAVIEWYGLYGGIEACYDMTDINGRAGRYNEIESFAGYTYSHRDFSASLGYVYKACGGDEGDTQEVELEFEYETPWVTPYVEIQLDTWRTPGAFYGAFGLVREWALTDCLALVTSGNVGVGNARRNEADFDRDAVGCREVRLGVSLEIALCPCVKLIPSVDFYDYFTDEQRAVYDKYNGFAAVGGCHLAVEF